MTSGSGDDGLTRGHPIPLTRQLAAALEAAIRDGHLGAGANLPSTRDLARRLKVHRSTVGTAYRRLHRRGCIEMRRGRRPSVPERSSRPHGLGHEPTTAAATAIVRAALRDAAAAGVPPSAILETLRETCGGPAGTGRVRHLGLFEPRPGLRASLAAELAERLRVRVRPLERPPRATVAGPVEPSAHRDPTVAPVGPVLLRREVLARLDARTSRSGGRPSLRPDCVPVSLSGGTRERGIVRRVVRAGLVVLLSPSDTVRRYAAELAVREYARGVSFIGIDPRDRAAVIRATATARLVLFDAASRAGLHPGRARAEPIRLLAERDIEALRGYLFGTPAMWCGT